MDGWRVEKCGFTNAQLLIDVRNPGRDIPVARPPPELARRFANPHHTFLVQRFDRTTVGRRLHFASAMTFCGHQDGDDASTGGIYLEIARVLIDHGAQTGADLRELWSRIVFNLLAFVRSVRHEFRARIAQHQRSRQRAGSRFGPFGGAVFSRRCEHGKHDHRTPSGGREAMVEAC